MLSPEMIRQLQANATAPSYAFTPPEQKKKRNFWLDQLSTGTSIVGGIGGGLLGGLAGGVGAVPGAAIGAGGGGALGEAIENLIDPEGGNWGNVAKEGALSAVMGAGPIKLAKFGTAGTKALATGADDALKIANQAALTPLRQKAGQATLGAADNLAIKNFRFTPTQLTNFQSRFGKDAGEVVRKYGFNTADDIASKGIEPLQSQFDELVTSIPGVTKDALRDNLYKKVGKLSSSAPSDSKAIGQQLKSEVDTLLKSFKGDVISGNELNSIRRQFDSLVNYTEKAANPSRYGVNKRMADGIRTTLQKADPTGQLKDVGRELSMLRQLESNALRQGNLGRGSLPVGISGLPGAVMGSGAGGPGGAAVGYAMNVAANSPTGRRAALKSFEKIGGKLANTRGGLSSAGIAGRLGATGLFKGGQNQAEGLDGALTDQSLENASTTTTTTNTNMPMPNSSNMGQSYNTQDPLSSALTSQSPYSRENLMADINRDPANAKDYIEYYAMLDEIFNPPAAKEKPLSGTQQKEANTALSALDDLNLMSSEIGRDGAVAAKAALPFDSFTNRFTGAGQFEASRRNIVDALARLRSGAALTETEMQNFGQLTPTAFDSPEDTRAKLARLQAIFERTAYGQTGAGGLEDALMSQQQYAY
jgi:hypothetical protein